MGLIDFFKNWDLGMKIAPFSIEIVFFPAEENPSIKLLLLLLLLLRIYPDEGLFNPRGAKSCIIFCSPVYQGWEMKGRW